MEEVKKYSVYMHIFPNGKKYIGITCVPEKQRWVNGKGYTQSKMQKAIEQFGWENIEHKILFSGLTQTEASEKEKAMIAQYRTAEENFGYNTSVGGVYNKNIAFTETRTKAVVFRQPQAEYEELKNDAHRHEMNVSDYLRWLIETEREKMQRRAK